MENNKYVFISYSTKNQESADTMRDILRKNGIKTWMAPGDIPAGNRYAKVINRALKDCSCLVLILSNDSQNSVWVSKEVERAINYHKPIVPVQIEDVVLNDEFELYISTDQIIVIQKLDMETQEMRRIISSLYSCIKRGENKNDTESTNFYLESKDNSLIKFYLENANLIGRDRKKSTISIRSSFVSKVHALINCIDGKWYVRDLHTLNGTFLNNTKLCADVETEINIGDVVKFGDKEFIFCGIVR